MCLNAADGIMAAARIAKIRARVAIRREPADTLGTGEHEARRRPLMSSAAAQSQIECKIGQT